MNRTLLIAGLLGLSTASCGSSSDTTATGATYSGTYVMSSFKLSTDNCQNHCPDLSAEAPTWVVAQTDGSYTVTVADNNNVFPATAGQNAVKFGFSAPLAVDSCTGTETATVVLTTLSSTASATIDVDIKADCTSTTLPVDCDCVYLTSGSRRSTVPADLIVPTVTPTPTPTPTQATTVGAHLIADGVYPVRFVTNADHTTCPASTVCSADFTQNFSVAYVNASTYSVAFQPGTPFDATVVNTNELQINASTPYNFVFNGCAVSQTDAIVIALSPNSIGGAALYTEAVGTCNGSGPSTCTCGYDLYYP